MPDKKDFIIKDKRRLAEGDADQPIKDDEEKPLDEAVAEESESAEAQEQEG